MTSARITAVQNILASFASVAKEYAGSAEEEEQYGAEALAALAALGVTEQEVLDAVTEDDKPASPKLELGKKIDLTK